MATSLLTRVRAKIELRTAKRMRGLISGRERSLYKGRGEDFDDLKFYEPGDDPSDIDWKATARSGEPLIRRFNEERARNIALVVDTGAAMAANAADGTLKRDAAIMAAGLVCFLAQRAGDQVALVAGHASRPIQLPARSSTGHLEMLLRYVQNSIRLDGPSGDLAWLLRRASRILLRRSLLFIITDEARPGPECEPLIRLLTTRHDVVVIRIADLSPLAEDRLDADVSDIRVPRRLPPLLRRQEDLAADVRRVVLERRSGVDAMLARVHVTSVFVQGETDVSDVLVRALARRARRGR